MDIHLHVPVPPAVFFFGTQTHRSCRPKHRKRTPVPREPTHRGAGSDVPVAAALGAPEEPQAPGPPGMGRSSQRGGGLGRSRVGGAWIFGGSGNVPC